MTALEVYSGSDGELTKQFYAELEKRGPIGIIGLNLFRAQKCSARAKVYRGGIRGRGSFKGMAYDRKSWSMDNLCKALLEHGKDLAVVWGWKEDPGCKFGMEDSWVLYVELPGIGQVSFHSPSRGQGPTYRSDWDGQKLSDSRIVEFCELVYRGQISLTQIEPAIVASEGVFNNRELS